MAETEAEGTPKAVSVAEFFERNRHLLGFDNPTKALLTSVKEAVDNSLDACETARISPEIFVQIVETGKDRYRVTIEDNGPGIVKKHLTRSFGQLLYGSKFQSYGGKQSRGQQGIGISAVILYGQLTTGRPAKITSKTKQDEQANQFLLHIDVKKNEPDIVESTGIEWDKEHGVRLEVEIQAKYVEHKQSVVEYLKQTSVVNPHAKLTFVAPDGQKIEFPRVTEVLPKEPKHIRPHPYGIELGILKRMIKATKARSIKSFLTTEFDKVGAGTAENILKTASLDPRILPRLLTPEQEEKLIQAMQDTKIMNPSTDCLSPIGDELLKKSLESEYDVEWVQAISRSPSVYRGNPFQIEVAIAYGGSLEKEGTVKLIRFANRVPLLYQEGACAITKAAKEVSWKTYDLQQSEGNLPTGPAIIAIAMSSVWVPFTSEGKEAIANYPEIVKEIKLALQDCGRQLQHYISRKERSAMAAKRQEIFKNYSVELAESLAQLTGKPKKEILDKLLKLAEEITATIEEEEKGISEPLEKGEFNGEDSNEAN